MGGAFTGAKHTRAGLFETADGGTIFLDEIGDLSLAMQPKLLRVLQEGAVRRVGANAERRVDVRVVAATNSNLEEKVREGHFREDLFWRLNVIQLRAPALRDRGMDIPLLVAHFIEKYCLAAHRPALEITSETLAILTAYSWPGNVRELENAIERAVAFSQGAVITPEALPERIRSTGGVAAVIARASEKTLSMREVEREYILEMLRRTDGNKKRAAELLGMDRKTLYRKLDEYRAEDPSLEV
ncbi:MAG: sigma 54-interacting transcriptional regulator [Blastocatellia bacterium]